jgi:hypothetical protein
MPEKQAATNIWPVMTVKEAQITPACTPFAFRFYTVLTPKTSSNA